MQGLIELRLATESPLKCLGSLHLNPRHKLEKT